MILSPERAASLQTASANAAPHAAATPVPGWLRQAVPDAKTLAGKEVEDVALAVGAAIGALDAVVRREEKWAGAWRQRLALAAAATTAKHAGRVEDEAELRDAVLLTRPGDDVGPAGRLLLGWLGLSARPAQDLLTEKNLGAVLEAFGYAPDAVGDLAEKLRKCSTRVGTVATLAGAFTIAQQYGFGRALGAWFTDALLAQRLGWAHAVPLLGTEMAASMRSDRSRGAANATIGIEAEKERAKALLAAQARAALRAIDLSAELGRRADRLLAVAPKLRAKGADIVVQRLLSGDAMVASDPVAGMSDRGLRRLFDRLFDLGAVRELSGRPTFRIYGL
ncbi:DUF1403 family protein [Mesorhizobium denitrificans]|uniref:DUF1403 family protein n=1 Tax=Mesorhizobium denitrificans TaxID=2294114 RepID=A0A371X3S0_9HYPH|nr:DUF1403 family protein [Mesorhizobium denitrificans]RFC63872.1 DUF1403 family protein [Mesorhizobium denitrificans]